MYDEINIALRLGLMTFTVWIWVLTLRHSKDIVAKWAGICLFSAVLFLYSPEHIMRISETARPDWLGPLMLVGANSLLFSSILLSISTITRKYTKPISTLRVMAVGWGTVLLFYLIGH